MSLKNRRIPRTSSSPAFRRTLLSLLVVAVILAPASPAMPWSDEAMLTVLEDVMAVAPRHVADLMLKNRDVWERHLANAKDQPTLDDPDGSLNVAVKILQSDRATDSVRVKAIIDTLYLTMQASSPGHSVVMQRRVDESQTCYVAEFDGYDAVPTLARRLELTQRALADKKLLLSRGLSGRHDRREQSAALGACYHVAFNDAADVLALIEYRAFGGKPRPAVGRTGYRVAHERGGDYWRLPTTWDSIPALADYYSGFGSLYPDITNSRRLLLKPQNDGWMRSAHAAGGPVADDLPTMDVSAVRTMLAESHSSWNASRVSNETATDAPRADSGLQLAPASTTASRLSFDLPEKAATRHVIASSASLKFPDAPDYLDNEVVVMVMKDALPRLRHQYSRTVQGQSGRIVVEFNVTPAGEVVDLNVAEDTIRNSQFTREVQRIVGQVRFPTHHGDGPVRVVYPMMFEAGA
ncbi:AgmX/PglI C-terminal domain-containing protein [bacterium]|nr:AgmX/PglI C-terminal domain-containing protein [bacterium]